MFYSSRAIGLALTVAACLALFETASRVRTVSPPAGARWNQYGWPAPFLKVKYTASQEQQWQRFGLSPGDMGRCRPAELPLDLRKWRDFRPGLFVFDLFVCLAIVVATAVAAELGLRHVGAGRRMTVLEIITCFVVIAAWAALTRLTHYPDRLLIPFEWALDVEWVMDESLRLM